MAAVDANTLDTLRITTLEDREQLLSAIYNELHPPTTISRRLNSVLGTFLSLQINIYPNPVCDIYSFFYFQNLQAIMISTQSPRH